MSDGVISLDSVDAVSSNDDSTDSQSTASTSDAAELRDVCEQLGADHDHAQAYVDENGSKSDLIDFAQRLLSNEELWESQEEYRRMNCIHRIILRWLRADDAEYTAYTGEFYGDSDDPEPGTYNHVQERSRESDGNLMFYQALFPEPVTAYWDSDPVLWHEFDSLGYEENERDTHIYVTLEFAEQYGDYTIDGKPRPPSNSELDGGSSSSSDSSSSGGNTGGLLLDPSDFTVPDLRDKLQDHLEGGASPDQFRDVLEAEQASKDRKTARKAIKGAKNEADSRDDDDTEQQDISEAAAAGDANSQPGVDIPPEKVMELMDNGWEKQEIIEFYG